MAHARLQFHARAGAGSPAEDAHLGEAGRPRGHLHTPWLRALHAQRERQRVLGVVEAQGSEGGEPVGVDRARQVDRLAAGAAER